MTVSVSIAFPVTLQPAAPAGKGCDRLAPSRPGISKQCVGAPSAIHIQPINYRTLPCEARTVRITLTFQYGDAPIDNSKRSWTYEGESNTRESVPSRRPRTFFWLNLDRPARSERKPGSRSRSRPGNLPYFRLREIQMRQQIRLSPFKDDQKRVGEPAGAGLELELHRADCEVYAGELHDAERGASDRALVDACFWQISCARGSTIRGRAEGKKQQTPACISRAMRYDFCRRGGSCACRRT